MSYIDIGMFDQAVELSEEAILANIAFFDQQFLAATNTAWELSEKAIFWKTVLNKKMDTSSDTPVD